MADPHAMPAHPTVNNPKSHKAHNKKNATQHYDGSSMAPSSDTAPPAAFGGDTDGDGY